MLKDCCFAFFAQKKPIHGMTDDSLGLIKNCIVSTVHGSIHRRYISLWKEVEEKESQQRKGHLSISSRMCRFFVGMLELVFTVCLKCIN